MGLLFSRSWGKLGLIALLSMQMLYLAPRPAWAEADSPLSPTTDTSPFGIAHIAYGSDLPNDQRYNLAASAGARWNRWALYWNEVEIAPGVFDFSAIDRTVQADSSHGFGSNVVLMGTPHFYATAGSFSAPSPRIDTRGWPPPQIEEGPTTLSACSSTTSAPSSLFLPIFADSTDYFVPGKQVNGSNPWARFVNTTVSRYRDQVKYWEMWNEPDFAFFWMCGTSDPQVRVQTYARLLKVGYLAAKSADPEAKVLLGGMMYWEWANRTGQQQAWLKAFLDQLEKDSARMANNYYFDIIPWHWYSRSSDIYWRVRAAEVLLKERGILGKKMWVNESNAPACGEPPNNAPCEGRQWNSGTATLEEQAAFVIQAFAWGLAAGLDRLFIFQLYDDGNSSSYGLIRNDGTARPAYAAYKVASSYLNGATSASRRAVGDAEVVEVWATPSGEPRRRLTVAWSRTSQPIQVEIDAISTSAKLVNQDGGWITVTSSNGKYLIALPAATNNRSFDLNTSNDFIIGGKPKILVEYPSTDTGAPTSRLGFTTLVAIGSWVNISWSATDQGWGIESYDVQYQIVAPDAQWQFWLSATKQTSAIFFGAPNTSYRFRVRARDQAGNVESWPTDDKAGTVRFLASDAIYRVLLPNMLKSANGSW